MTIKDLTKLLKKRNSKEALDYTIKVAFCNEKDKPPVIRYFDSWHINDCKKEIIFFGEDDFKERLERWIVG